MATFHVQPDGYLGLRVYSSRLGHTITFVDGAYETSDPAEIRVLQRNRYCFDVDELESDLTTPDPPVGADQDAVDDELANLKAEIDDENAEAAPQLEDE